MAAGWSRVRIFSNAGIPISEIDVATQRSWVLNDVGRCQFTINTYDPQTGAINPDCSLANFQYGNLVLIEHSPSVEADGSVNGILPSWVGIILPPQDWTYGKLTITAYSAENILAFRPMPHQTVKGAPGALFASILQLSNNLGGMAIQPGQIDAGGAINSRNLTVSAFEEIQDIVAQSGMDFEVIPVVGSNGVLSLYGNWYQSKGVYTGQLLTDKNLESGDPIYTEQGDIYNQVFAYSDANTSATKATAVVADADAQSLNGILAVNVNFPATSGNGKSPIAVSAAAFIQANKKPTRTFAPTVLDVGNSFSYLVLGNTWTIQSTTVGFSDGGVGLQGIIRITAMEYAELTNMVKFAGVLQ